MVIHTIVGFDGQRGNIDTFNDYRNLLDKIDMVVSVEIYRDYSAGRSIEWLIVTVKQKDTLFTQCGIEEHSFRFRFPCSMFYK